MKPDELLTIYHNPECSKSCATLEIIKEYGEKVKIVEYLTESPDAETLRMLLKKLRIRPEQLIRKTENIYLEKFQDKTLTDEEWIGVMVKYPELIERPVVVKGDKAVLGRPPKNVLQLL